MLKRLESYPILTICIVTALMMLPGLNSIPVSIMEARNFVTAREMINDGHWILTTMNGLARYEKPPLPTWLTAFSSMIFGVKSVFAMRLPTVLFMMITGVFIFKISDLLTENRLQSLLNGFVAITSFYVLGITVEAPWDIFTHGFMLVAIYYTFNWLQTHNNNLKNVLLAILFIGFSFLSKGPVSLFALLLPFILSYGIVYKYTKRSILSVIGILLLGIALGASWFIYVRLKDPATFTAIAQKETGNWSSYNVRPFYYYWSFFTQSGIWTIPAFMSLLYPYLKNRVTNKKGYLFSFLWTIIAVILLSLIPEKKSRYLMPVLLPLSINIGFYLNYLIREFKALKDKRETLPVYFNFGLIGTIAIVAPFLIYFMLSDKLSNHWLQFALLTIVSLICGVLFFLKLKKKELLHVIVLTVSFFVGLVATGLPLAGIFKTENYRSFDEIKTDYKSLEIYGLEEPSPEIIWSFGEKIQAIKNEDSTISHPHLETFGLLSSEYDLKKNIDLLQSKYQIKEVGSFDLNTAASNSRSYKTRLHKNLYILTRR
ncbi:ArnT family glycosyltransferase [Mangrovimonas aestuarii]|uniref:ArnT family glycosyltransferase n=1 Tax=Mangrovimonas aestuarii TaxID=3018443 RepID=UPI0023786393|nr:glycosyltransferase family 39 protein [Mangrovimonas aestuarii]